MADYTKIVSLEGSDDLEQDPLAMIRRRWNLDGSVQLGAVPVPMRPLYVAIIRDMRWLVNEVIQSRIGMVSIPDDYNISDNRPSNKKTTRIVSTTKPKKRKLLVEKQMSLFDEDGMDEGPDEEVVSGEE